MKSKVYFAIFTVALVLLSLSSCEWFRDVFGIDPDIKVGPEQLASTDTQSMVTAQATEEDLIPTLMAIFRATGASMENILPSAARSIGGGVNFFIKNEPIWGYAYVFGEGGTITDEVWRKLGDTNNAELAAEVVVNKDSSLINDKGEPDPKTISIEVKGALDLEFDEVTHWYDYDGWSDEHFLYTINDGFLKAFGDVKANAEVTQEITQAMVDAGWVDTWGDPLESSDVGDPAEVSAGYDVSSGATLALSVDGSVDTQGVIKSGKYILTVAFKAKTDVDVKLAFATAAEAESAEEQIFTSEEIVLVVEAYDNANKLIGTWEYTSTEFFESGGVEALYTPFFRMLTP